MGNPFGPPIPQDEIEVVRSVDPQSRQVTTSYRHRTTGEPLPELGTVTHMLGPRAFPDLVQAQPVAPTPARSVEPPPAPSPSPDPISWPRRSWRWLKAAAVRATRFFCFWKEER